MKKRELPNPNANQHTPLLHDENRIQQSIYTWFTNTYCLAHHAPRSLILAIPNQNQQHLTGIGVLAGASDMIAIHAPSLTFIWVEVKDHKGRQSGAQQAFQQRVEVLGYTYILTRSLDAFKAVILGLDAQVKTRATNHSK